MLWANSYAIMELDYQEIGRNVRNYRMKKGLNQRELAELVNVSDQHISHIENAHTKLGLPTLVAIANALETDCNSLAATGLRPAFLYQCIQQLSGIIGRGIIR